MKEMKKVLMSLTIILLSGGIIYWVANKSSANMGVKSASSTKNVEPRAKPVKQPKKKESANLPSSELVTQILTYLAIWQAKSAENSTQEKSIVQTIQTWQNSQIDQAKKQALQKLLDEYSDYEESSLILRETANYQALKKTFAEWKRTINQQSEQQEKAKWFTPKRWLTDKEIDWALEQLAPDSRFKILPAYQFHYVLESKGEELGFPELLNQLQDEAVELIFIPVNNPDFHWSLLVYGVKDKTFWHHDTLQGANDSYIKPLVADLLIQLRQENEPDLSKCLKTNYAIRQGNGHDCGVAVIEIAKRIMEKHQDDLNNLDLGGFDFPQARKGWRKVWEEQLN